MKRIVAIVLVLALVVCLGACAPKEDQTESTTTAPTTATTTAPPAIEVDTTLNLLTGESNLTGSNNRPVGIMITNEPGIIGNQYGIDKADFYMETETEGSIPRILAMFGSSDRIPEKLGPVRSARTPFIATAKAFGAVYVYSGATTYVKNIIKNSANFDAITNTDSTTLWRDSYLKANANVSWNTLITGGEQLTNKITSSKIATQAFKETPLTFGEKTGDQAATTVELKSTASTNVTFLYDAETGLYGKNNGKASDCTPQKSQEGNQIQVTNVLILYAEKFVEEKNSTKTWYNFKEGEGTGYLISGGTAREIKFNRTNESLTLTETDGTPALFATGKTYMFLADKALQENLKIS